MAVAVGVVLASSSPMSSAASAPSSDGARFVADAGAKLGFLKVSTDHGVLRGLSFRALAGVRAAAPDRALGKRVGTLELSFSSSPTRPLRQIALLMPSRRTTQMTLARTGDLRVILRPGRHFMLSVYGIGAGTTGAAISFSGSGRGVLAAPESCPGTTSTQAFIDRSGAADVKLVDSVRCGRT